MGTLEARKKIFDILQKMQAEENFLEDIQINSQTLSPNNVQISIKRRIGHITGHIMYFGVKAVLKPASQTAFIQSYGWDHCYQATFRDEYEQQRAGLDTMALKWLESLVKTKTV
jgi:hypothetical protein